MRLTLSELANHFPGLHWLTNKPRPIPKKIVNEISDLLKEIKKGKPTNEIRYIIGVVRAKTEPEMHNYQIDDSNQQIRLLNEQLAREEYLNLQVSEYQGNEY